MPRRAPLGFDAAAHERHHWWRSLLLKLAVGSVVSWLAWRFAEIYGLLVSLMLWARLLADDLMALIQTAWQVLRGLAFRPVQGRFYQFKGQRIRVLDDELLPQRWLALDDLATALGAPIPAQSLRRRQPEGLSEEPDGLYVLDEVALAWLRDRRDDRAGRLAHWVEREVWYPARGRKASYEERRAPGPSQGAPSED